MSTIDIVYLKVTSIPKFPEIVNNAIDTHSDVILLGVYDSGRIPDHLAPIIRRATERDIVVFGARQTLFDNLVKEELIYGREPLDEDYEMQPEALRAGLIPLQMYPPELLEIANDIKTARDANPNYPITAARINLNSEKLLEYFSNSINEIWSEYDNRTERIDAARRRFSSDAFNRRIDEALL